MTLGLHHGINDNLRLKLASSHNKQNKAHFQIFMSRFEMDHPANDFVAQNLEGPIIGLSSEVFHLGPELRPPNTGNSWPC